MVGGLKECQWYSTCKTRDVCMVLCKKSGNPNCTHPIGCDSPWACSACWYNRPKAEGTKHDEGKSNN